MAFTRQACLVKTIMNLLKQRGIPMDYLDSMNDRIVFHKIVYLLQELGFSSEFSYNWGHFGPFSQQLVNVAYTVIDEWAWTMEIELSENERRIFDNLLKCVISLREYQSSVDLFEPLECMVGIHYLYQASPAIGDNETRWRSVEKRINDQMPKLVVKHRFSYYRTLLQELFPSTHVS